MWRIFNDNWLSNAEEAGITFILCAAVVAVSPLVLVWVIVELASDARRKRHGR